MLNVILMGSMATAASAVAAISRHVCLMISNRDKARSIDKMADLMKDCPAPERGIMAATIVKVTDSFFPQPHTLPPIRRLRHRSRK